MARSSNVLVDSTLQTVEYLTGTDRARRILELKEKRMLDEISAKKYAENRGMAKGIAKGKAEGKAEGKTEGKIEVAKKLIKLGTDMATIETVTGFTKQKIRSLIKEEKYTKSF